MRHVSLSFTLLAIASAAHALEEPAPDVVVSAARVPTAPQAVPVALDVIDSDDLREQGFQPTTADRLRGTTGVTVVSQYGGIDGGLVGVRLRGLDARYTQVLLDGIPLGDPTSTDGSANLSFVNPSGLDRIEVLRGSQSGLYGSGAMGGVIDLRTERPGSEQRFGGALTAGSFGTLAADARWSGPLTPGLGLAASAQGLRSDSFSAQTTDLAGDPGDHEADALRRVGGNLRLEATAGHGQVYGAVNVQETQQEYDETGPDDDRARLDGTTLRLAGGGEVRLAPQVLLAADLATTAVTNERAAWTYPAPFYTPVPAEKNYEGRDDYATVRITGGDGRVDTPHPGGLVTTGIDVRRASGRQETNGATDWDDHDSQVGAWGHGLIGSRRLTLSGALRYDHHSEFDGVTTGRIAAGATPTDVWTLRAAYATGYRAPSLYQRFGSEGGDYPFQGNPDLQPEESQSIEAGVDVRPLGEARQLLISITGFRSDFTDKIEYDYGVSPATFQNLDTKAMSRGIESAIEANDIASHGDVRLWYTYTSTDDGTGAMLGYVPRHLGGGRIGVHGDASDWRWRAGVSAEYTGNYRAYMQSVGPYGGLGMMPSYVVANLDAGVTWRGTWDLALSLRNALDEDYAVTEGYSTMPRAVFATVSASF